MCSHALAKTWHRDTVVSLEHPLLPSCQGKTSVGVLVLQEVFAGETADRRTK